MFVCPPTIVLPCERLSGSQLPPQSRLRRRRSTGKRRLPPSPSPCLSGNLCEEKTEETKAFSPQGSARGLAVGNGADGMQGSAVEVEACSPFSLEELDSRGLR